MTDFGLDRYDLSRITRRIPLPEISPDPAKPFTLIVCSASNGNRGYRNALFKRSKQDDAVTDPLVRDEAALAELAQDLAGTVIVGWENVFEDGKPLAFSAEAANRLVVELLTRVRDVWNARVAPVIWSDPGSFRTAPDPVELGKE